MKCIYTEQIVSEDRTAHNKERALSNDYFAPLDLNNYHTDKITNGYMNVYGPIFAPLRSKPIKLLELGVLGGESLRLWRDYFWNGIIMGLDLNPVTINGRRSESLYTKEHKRTRSSLSNRTGTGFWRV